VKAIQITLDERLLARLDADEEVKRDGRSAVMRRAVFDYLRKKRRSAVAEAYRRAYGGRKEAELEGWADEGVWPEEECPGETWTYQSCGPTSEDRRHPQPSRGDRRPSNRRWATWQMHGKAARGAVAQRDVPLT